MRLGADPEVFLCNHVGKIISVIGMIGAGKHNPLQIPFLPKGFTLQEDNVALEYGIPPASSEDEFVYNIQSVINAGASWTKGLGLSTKSCVLFDEDQMSHPAAWKFGCEPDKDAWKMGRYNPAPQPPHPLMRSAGGHVHIETKAPKVTTIQYMDLFLGVPSVLMDEGTERRKFYGKPGAYRSKPYGVEYRTLSNFWIFSEELIRLVWQETRRVMDLVAYPGQPIWGLRKEIQQCLNNNDKKLASDLVKRYNLKVL